MLKTFALLEIAMEDMFFDQYIVELAHNQINKEELLTKQQEIAILKEIADESQKICKNGDYPELKNLLRKAGY